VARVKKCGGRPPSSGRSSFRGNNPILAALYHGLHAAHHLRSPEQAKAARVLREVDARRIAGEVGVGYLGRGMVSTFHDEEMPQIEKYARRYLRASATIGSSGRMRTSRRSRPRAALRIAPRSGTRRIAARNKSPGSSSTGDDGPEPEPPDLDEFDGFRAASSRMFAHVGRRLGAARVA
jgi:hypothetical protein